MYIDLHLIHEVTSPQGFDVLRERGIPVRRPDRTLGTIDHSTPTLPPRHGIRPYVTEQARIQVDTLQKNCEEFGIELHGWDSPHRGIVHVIGPELGISQPGKTIVCGDSHTSTHGAFGALAFGIGTTQVGHVLATQCLLMSRPRSMRVSVAGTTGKGVTAKDLVLHIINHIGVDGGTGHVIEYAGSAIRALSMEGRMTVCNMSIEAGARAGMVAPDGTTLDYLRGRPKLRDSDFDRLAPQWLALASDTDAGYDRDVSIDAAEIAPRVTYGTHPGMSIPVDGVIPDPAGDGDRKALDYMGLASNQPLQGHPVNVVFIGSCTNSRIEDLREAASVVAGKQVASGVDMLVVPGSEQVRMQAEAEGLHRIFENAGAQWRIPGCSMCLGMNGDIVSPGATAISTSNRNFEGRQGPGARTLLASPATAAASALTGGVADPRTVETSTLERA